jgi:ribosome-associated heat shock protein Hsp15
MKKAAIDSPSAAAVRLDIWLWSARFFRTRSLARQAIDAGKIEHNEASGKPSRAVHAGDALRIRRGDDVFEVQVVGVTERRGPVAAAQSLYRETEESRAAREALRERRRLEGAGFAKPATKPDKRARRLIRALGDIDAF